jgi:hypothetical protein
MLIQIKRQAAIKELRGKLPWEGSLDTMRTDSSFSSIFPLSDLRTSIAG